MLLAACGGGPDVIGGPDGSSDSGPITIGDGGNPTDGGIDAGTLADGGCGLAVFNSGSYDIDLHAVSISGTVTLGGQSAPESNPRGAIVFMPAGHEDAGVLDGGLGLGDASLVTVLLPNTGAATYSTRLFAGNYDATFSKSGACGAGLLPCGTQLLQSDLSLFSSGSLNLDVTPAPGLITVSGTVTKNGAQIPSGARGMIEFVLSSSASSMSAAGIDSTFPSSGDATYSVMLAPGTYDIRIIAPGTCTQSSPLPCQIFVARHAMALSNSGSLAIDLSVVQLSGSVTANGAVLADATLSRGSLALLDTDGNGPSIDLGSHGAATYSANLYAGAHDLVISPPVNCALPLPCGKHLAAHAISVAVSGSYALDLPINSVTGHVTTNNQQPGAAAHGSIRGAVQFTLGQQTFLTYDNLGASGPATYTAALYSGSYQISLVNPTDCPDGPLPCGTRILQSGAAINTSGAFDLNIASAHITLDVTVNGAAFPVSPTASARGTVTLHGPTDVVVSLPGTGAASAQATVYAGTHDLLFSNTNDCPDGPAPCQSYKAASAKSITADGMVTVDLPVLDLSGHVTGNGQTIPNSMSGGARGTLQFSQADLGFVLVPLGTSGDFRYQVRLFPATYKIGFFNSTDCPGALPCGDGSISTATAISTSGSLDIDIPFVTLSGTVTLDGAPLADGSATRGVLIFGNDSGATQTSLGQSGAAHYQTKLLPGTYGISVLSAGACGVSSPLPCGTAPVTACGH